MATSRKEISEWFDIGLQERATHLIVVVDTFDYDDYPVYVTVGQDPRKVFEEYNGKNMQRVMEVYSMALPKEPQLNESTSMHFELVAPANVAKPKAAKVNNVKQIIRPKENKVLADIKNVLSKVEPARLTKAEKEILAIVSEAFKNG